MYPLEEIPREITKFFEFHDLYNKEGLFPHQEFVRRFMSPHTPYNSILLYHSPGSGKSLICISISVDHYMKSSMTTVIVTKGESGSNSFRKQILKYMEKLGFKLPLGSIFHMDHYISLHNKITVYSDRDIKWIDLMGRS